MKHAFLDIYSERDSVLHRLDPRMKILACFCLIIAAVSAPPEGFCIFLGYLFVLAFFMAISRLPVLFVLKRSLVILPFVGLMVVVIPFLPEPGSGSISVGWGGINVSRGGLLLAWNIFIKAFIGVAAMIFLTSTTPFPKLLEAFLWFKIPRLFIVVAGFMYRYLFVITDEALRMRIARDSRSFGGRWLWHARVVGMMIGSLFIRSYGRAERIYAAMVSRGFDGTYFYAAKFRLRVFDVAFAVLFICMVVVMRLFL